MSKALVLLSSGLDSTVNLYSATRHFKSVTAVTFDYGQRAAAKEIPAAKNIADRLGLAWRLVELPFFKNLGESALTNSQVEVPQGAKVNIQSLEASEKSAKSVWVPNRNGVFLNIAAAFAEAMGADAVIPGFNKEEATTFPDNSTEFMGQLTRALSFSTANKVRVECFTDKMNKTEIVALGKRLGVDFSQIWPCYFAGDNWCGTCESCQRSLRALRANGVQVG